MKYVLDTDHISILERKSGAAYSALERNLQLHQSDGIGVSVSTLHEQMLGAHNKIIQAKTPAEFVRGYEILFMVLEQHRQYAIVPYEAPAHSEFLRLRSSKVRIGTMDLRIAAVALARDLVVVTRNVADFSRVPGLKHCDWSK